MPNLVWDSFWRCTRCQDTFQECPSRNIYSMTHQSNCIYYICIRKVFSLHNLGSCFLVNSLFDHMLHFLWYWSVRRAGLDILGQYWQRQAVRIPHYCSLVLGLFVATTIVAVRCRIPICNRRPLGHCLSLCVYSWSLNNIYLFILNNLNLIFNT